MCSLTALFRLLSIVTLIIFAVSACDGGPRMCRSLKRPLSDEELFQIAIRDQISSGRLSLADDGRAIQGFLKKNPRCCSVDPPPPSGIDRLLRYDGVDLEVNFKVAEGRVKSVGPYYEGHALIRPCGEVDSAYGTGTETLELASNS